MPGAKQSDITKFFSPKGKPKEQVQDSKTPTKDVEETSPMSKPLKRKLEEDTPQTESGDTNKDQETQNPCPLSPEQKKRMMNNKTLAMIRLTSRKLPFALHEAIGPSWFDALKDEFDKPYFLKLNSFMETERKSSVKIFPPHDEVWSWTHHFPIEDTKVVILGQDPYHGPGQAHGLCFSVKRPVKPPPSLLNMYKELVDDIEGFQKPQHGCLLGWSKQGVLLLNACLTVRQAQANSHKDKGWETLTTAVVKAVNEKCSGVVFLLWGSYAQKKAELLNKQKHHLLKTVHPSPLSAHRGFLGSKHFSKCNEILVQQGKSPIDWKALDN